MTSPRRRGRNGLKNDILGHLTRPEAAWETVAAIHAAVGGTSAGAVHRSLRQLAATGQVITDGRRPQRWRIPATTGPTPSPSPAVGHVLTGATPVTRPNGQLYHPRGLAGESDVDVLRRLRTAGVPVLLYGPPGTGKTALAEAAHTDIITIAGDSDTTVADFIGEYTQAPDGTFVFTYGPLIRAMEEGRCLFVDDATLIAPTVLAALYPAMDGRGQVHIKARPGETVTAAPGFYVMGGHNPGVHGAVLTDALASRFSTHIEVSTDFDLADALGVPATAIAIARNLNRQLAAGECRWAPQLRELLACKRLATELGLDAAIANLAAIAPTGDRALVQRVAANLHGKAVTPLALGTQLSPPPQKGSSS
ncbi:AAA family ATPase [Phytomonospora endophytica]|uniref:MoxR-like ATPase n=1 Tax=Phytomonospora endophytica TaxID=714109 RepID=A0A841FYE0_9ACTN|nr:AAA family ATPase [Phytomonospora endophytica]MBB6038532.1 MoxR-like ATPase [Phytomonospora endophytica]GIG69328.1 hypothetical protein Pen01_56230 [Phytomonospora endophytica]